MNKGAMGDPVLQLQAIRRTFSQGGNDVEVLRGVELSVARGEIVALLGPSGSGKSTLLHIAGLLEQPSSGRIVIGGREIAYIDSSKSLPDWKALGVDVVIDCTGRASTRSGAEAHLAAGAGRVLVSAPSKTREDCDAVLLPGINLETFDPVKHRIISMASCTTNALAPVVKVVIPGLETVPDGPDYLPGPRAQAAGASRA